jgi:ribosomal protein L29
LKNVDLATNQAKQIIGLPPEQQLTSDAFKAYRKNQGNNYQAVRNFDYKTDKVFVKELNDEIQNLRSLTTTSPEQISTLQSLAKTNIKGDDLVNNIIDLRDAGNSNMRSSDSKLNRLGKTQLKTATALEDVADRFLDKSGNPDIVSQFRQARKNIAQSHTIENAFDSAGNIIDPRKLAQMASNDQPIPSAMRTVSEAANKAPALFTPQKNFFGGRSPGLTDVVTGLAAGALTGNPLLATGAVARPAIREILTAGPVQRMMSPNIPTAGPLRQSARPTVSPYLMTTPFQPVTRGLMDYMNQNGQ